MTARKHATIRMQQRAIPPIVIDWLIDFGETQYDHYGGLIRYFDKQSRRKLERAVGRKVVARLSEYLDSYAVFSSEDHALITVGWRLKRVKAA